MLCRVKAVRSFLLVQELLLASQNATTEYILKQRQLVLSSVMTLQGLDSRVPDEDGEGFVGDDFDKDDEQFCLDETDGGFDDAPDFDGVQDFSGSWRAASQHLLPQAF